MIRYYPTLLFLLACTASGVQASIPNAVPDDASETVTTASIPNTPYYELGEKGWFWYEKPAEDDKKKKKAQQVLPPQVMPQPTTVAPKPDDDPSDPIVQLKLVQESIERAQARAILNPTPENVQAFMVINAQAQAQAGQFAQTWQQVLLSTPQLDYRQVRPVDDQAIHAYNDAKLAINEDFLREASKTYGLFFFFRSTCPYCHKLSPILKQFADTYGFHIVPISLDGQGLPEFPQFQTDQQIGQELKIEAVPAIFLVDPKKRDIQPVSTGYITWDELRSRIYTVLKGTGANPLQDQQDNYERYLQQQPKALQLQPDQLKAGG